MKKIVIVVFAVMVCIWLYGRHAKPPEQNRVMLTAGQLGQYLESLETGKIKGKRQITLYKKNGTIEERINDIEELCKDYLYYRNKIMRYSSEGKPEQLAEARQRFERMNVWLSEYDEADVSNMFSFLDRIGYKAP